MSEAAAPAAASAAAPEAAASAAAGAAAPPAPPTPAPAAPATAPATAPPATDTQDIASLPEWAQQILRDAQQAQAPTPPAPPAPPAPTAPQAPTEGDVSRLPRWAQQAVTDGQSAARQLAIQSAVIAAAPAAGADIARLLDSQTAMRALSAVDPSDAAAVQQAITNVLGTHQHLAAQTAPPAGPPRGGVEFTTSGAGEITPAQFAAMSYQQRAELYQSDPDTYRRLAGA